MNNFIFICKELWKGESVTRSFLNYRLKKEVLKGKTIDVGGGCGEKYISFMKKDVETTFETFDLKVGKEVDFEKDPLPALSGTYDTVLFLNVMEHIFNYQHIANEVVRVTKSGGQMIGFVPFLMWYHPDHKDFFRYTHEALQIILENAGATKDQIKIEVIGDGPFTASVQMILLSFPRILRVPVFTMFWLLDRIYSLLKSDKARKCELGYLFTVKN